MYFESKTRLVNFFHNVQNKRLIVLKAKFSSTARNCRKSKDGMTQFGILLPKLFGPTVRKNCSSDREKLLKFEAEGRELAKF